MGSEKGMVFGKTGQISLNDGTQNHYLKMADMAL